MTLTSTSRISPPASVQARPFTTPISSRSVCRDGGKGWQSRSLGRSSSVTVMRLTVSSSRRISALRQMAASRRSSWRTPDSRV